MIAAEDVVVRPHRRHLDRNRLAEIVKTARNQGMSNTALGAAVAYQPSVGYILIAGEHRWAALSAPGARFEVYVLSSWTDLVAWMAVDVMDLRRTPWNPISAVWFYEKAVEVLKPARSESPIADVSEFTDIHRSILEGVRWASAILADPNEPADVRAEVEAVLDELEAGKDGGHSIRERVHRFRVRREQAARPPQSAAVQRKALDSIAQLEGIVAALADLPPINPEIPMAEREAYARRLGVLGAQLSRVKKALRGER